jgi:hypothetical protein
MREEDVEVRISDLSEKCHALILDLALRSPIRFDPADLQGFAEEAMGWWADQ